MDGKHFTKSSLPLVHLQLFCLSPIICMVTFGRLDSTRCFVNCAPAMTDSWLANSPLSFKIKDMFRWLAMILVALLCWVIRAENGPSEWRLNRVFQIELVTLFKFKTVKMDTPIITNKWMPVGCRVICIADAIAIAMGVLFGCHCCLSENLLSVHAKIAISSRAVCRAQQIDSFAWHARAAAERARCCDYVSDHGSRVTGILFGALEEIHSRWNGNLTVSSSNWKEIIITGYITSFSFQHISNQHLHFSTTSLLPTLR